MVSRVDARRALLVSGMLFFCGCGATPPLSPDAGPPAAAPLADSVTGLHFTSSADPRSSVPTGVEVRLSDSTRVRAILEATLTLPDFPPGIDNCPVDLGVTDTMTFSGGGAVLLTAKLSPGGCREATILGAPPARETNDAYWKLLAENLGVAESSLLPCCGAP
jgi:hypothetical protein